MLSLCHILTLVVVVVVMILSECRSKDLVIQIRGVYRGESGRNLRPNWAKGGRELHPEGGKNSPRYMGNM